MNIQDDYPKYVIPIDLITKPKDYDGIAYLSLRTLFIINSL